MCAYMYVYIYHVNKSAVIKTAVSFHMRRIEEKEKKEENVEKKKWKKTSTVRHIFSRL